MTAVKPFPTLLLLLSLLAGFLPPPAEAADPFYTRLLERGVRDLELGLTDEAQKRLRTACFGFLDEPILLAEGLMQLGRAQALAGNAVDLTDTAERLVEIEDRFSAYSSFNGNLKTVFESSLRGALPEAQLARMPMFAHLILAAEPAVEQGKPKTPKQQRKALEQQLVASPDDTEALMELAQMHFATGKLKLASRLLDRLLATQPGHEQALCLRADIAIDRKECVPALAGLDRCPQLTASNQGAARVLACLASAQRSSEAMALLEALPADRRQAPIIARAARKIVKSAGILEAPAEPTQPIGLPPENGVPEPGKLDQPAQPAQAPGPKPAEQTDVAFPKSKIGPTLDERMRSLRGEVSESRFREQLEEAMRSAIELADDYPDSAEAQHLAAEIAYLSSDWRLVVDYFNRGGGPSAESPELLFYLAVATYELGNAQEAASILRTALPNLPRNSFVDSYIDKILAPPN